jgi:hypothetical protein
MIKAVLKELKAIKVNATPEEINRLDFSTLATRSTCGCYYGQMTGNCRSDRAQELYAKCMTENDMNPHLNDSSLVKRYTSLEIYSYNNSYDYKTQQRIINYLKGGQKTITLK